MVHPDVAAPVGLRAHLVGLDADAVGVAHFHLLSVAPCHDLVLAGLQHRHSLHREAAVADDDVVHALHHEGDVGEEGSLARLLVRHSHEGLVRSHEDALAAGGLNAFRTVLLVAELAGVDAVNVAFDTRGDVVVHKDNIGVSCLHVCLQLREVPGIHHFASRSAGCSFGAIIVGTWFSRTGGESVYREIPSVHLLCVCRQEESAQHERCGEQCLFPDHFCFSS